MIQIQFSIFQFFIINLLYYIFFYIPFFLFIIFKNCQIIQNYFEGISKDQLAYYYINYFKINFYFRINLIFNIIFNFFHLQKKSDLEYYPKLKYSFINFRDYFMNYLEIIFIFLVKFYLSFKFFQIIFFQAIKVPFFCFIIIFIFS